MESNGSAYYLLKQEWCKMTGLLYAAHNDDEVHGIAFLTEEEERHPVNVTIYDIEDIHSELIAALHNCKFY
jgi:hypothetical protein